MKTSMGEAFPIILTRLAEDLWEERINIITRAGKKELWIKRGTAEELGLDQREKDRATDKRPKP